MKRWTVLQATKGAALTPDEINAEIRAQQSSATTLDRSQLPAGFVSTPSLVPNALHQVWASRAFPTLGEQTEQRDPDVYDDAWISSTIQITSGSWFSVHGTALTLTGFKGGNLFFEWSCNIYVNNIAARGLNDQFPGSPNYARLRILINGIVVAERRGGHLTQTSRVVANADLPAGDLSVELQVFFTPASEDAPAVDTSGDHVSYGHIWKSRYLAIARYR
jgi:hypothetical protein